MSASLLILVCLSSCSLHGEGARAPVITVDGRHEIPSSQPTASEEKTPPSIPVSACSSDGDCTVANAIAGLDHIPDPSREACGDRCFVAIPAKDLEAWNAARARLERQVKCDKKFAKCGSPADSDVRARCRHQHCELVTAG